MTYEVWLAKKEATLLNVTAASDPASGTEIQVASAGNAIFGNLDGGEPGSNYGGISPIDAGVITS